MSKMIRMTPEYYEECRKDFEKALKNAKFSDGKVSFTKTFTAKKERATLFFTVEAWMKMLMLVQEFSKEVAWHGVAYRLDTEGKNEYLISDILVYPQEVTGSTVEMDTAQYAVWLQENEEDERFYNIHMQGHSHVNMAPNPSSVDLNHQEEILAQLGDDDFYIFIIINKSCKRNIKIYDLQKNILFEDSDVDTEFYGSDTGLCDFINTAKDMVKEKTTVYQPTYYQYPYGQQVGSPYNPACGIQTTQGASQPVTPASGQKGEKKSEKQEKPKTQIGAGWKGADAANSYGKQSSIYNYDDEDDDDDLYRRYTS